MARSKRGGECYAACGTAILLGELKGLLCQGEVFNPKSGRFHGHCWIENQVMSHGIVWVVDIGTERTVSMPRDAYYNLGRVRRVKRYTPEKARELLSKTKRWGPWHCGRKGKRV